VVADASNELAAAFESSDGLGSLSIGKPRVFQGRLSELRESVLTQDLMLLGTSCAAAPSPVKVGEVDGELSRCHRNSANGSGTTVLLWFMVRDGTATHVVCEGMAQDLADACEQAVRSLTLNEEFPRVAREWGELYAKGLAISAPAGWRMAPLIASRERADLVLSHESSVAMLKHVPSGLAPKEAAKAHLGPLDRVVRRQEALMLGHPAEHMVVSRNSVGKAHTVTWRLATAQGVLHRFSCSGQESGIEEVCARMADSLRWR
jgi:hypothetical protein